MQHLVFVLYMQVCVKKFSDSFPHKNKPHENLNATFGVKFIHKFFSNYNTFM